MTLIAHIVLLANLALTGPAPVAQAQLTAPQNASGTQPAPAPQTAPAPQVGEVTFYAPPQTRGASSLMKKVWNWRIYQGHVPECPECIDAIALVDPQWIGKKVWLQHPDGEIVGPLMVVDCAEAKHRPNLRKRGWVADISWELAMRWKMNAALEGVTILFEEPSHVDVTQAINIPTSCPATGCTKARRTS